MRGRILHVSVDDVTRATDARPDNADPQLGEADGSTVLAGVVCDPEDPLAE